MLRQFLSTAVTAVFSAIFLVAFAQTAGGAPYELATQVGANLGCIVGNGCNPAGNGDHDADFYIFGPDNGAGYVSVTNLTDLSGDTHFTYSAEANASFGKLQAGASGMAKDRILSVRGRPTRRGQPCHSSCVASWDWRSANPCLRAAAVVSGTP